MEKGNFGGQLGWFSDQGKNLPTQVNSQRNVVNEMTPVDSFESNVMGMTPAPEFSPVDEVPNPGFTPLNSFESILGSFQSIFHQPMAKAHRFESLSP